MTEIAATMRKPAETFLLDHANKRALRFAPLHPHVARSQSAVRDFVPRATGNSLWISYAYDLTDALVRNAAAVQPSLGLGLFLHGLDVETIPALTSCFRRIAFASAGGFLRAAELAEVLKAANRSDLFIGGSVDDRTATITLYRGDLRPLVAPFSAFDTSGDGTTPDWSRFSVADFGQTVRLGTYEAAGDAILYEYDADYRRRVAKMRLQEDRSFGAALRRLRKQRGLRRADFEPDVSAKTIARIEQGKVRRLQRKTLQVLGRRLAVDPREIMNY